MKEYLLLLRGGDARFAEMTEEESAAHMEQWRSFMGNLAQNGQLSGGMPLQHSGRFLTNTGSTEEVIKAENGEIIGGYLIIKANDYDEAITLSKACPIFDNDGNIEIREIMPMEM